jgi:hypothetical protein
VTRHIHAKLYMTTDHDFRLDTSRGSLTTDGGLKNDAEKKVAYMGRFVPGECDYRVLPLFFPLRITTLQNRILTATYSCRDAPLNHRS